MDCIYFIQISPRPFRKFIKPLTETVLPFNIHFQQKVYNYTLTGKPSALFERTSIYILETTFIFYINFVLVHDFTVAWEYIRTGTHISVPQIQTDRNIHSNGFCNTVNWKLILRAFISSFRFTETFIANAIRDTRQISISNPH